jgi:hypothetical protein
MADSGAVFPANLPASQGYRRQDIGDLLPGGIVFHGKQVFLRVVLNLADPGQGQHRLTNGVRTTLSGKAAARYHAIYFKGQSCHLCRPRLIAPQVVCSYSLWPRSGPDPGPGLCQFLPAEGLHFPAQKGRSQAHLQPQPPGDAHQGDLLQVAQVSPEAVAGNGFPVKPFKIILQSEQHPDPAMVLNGGLQPGHQGLENVLQADMAPGLEGENILLVFQHHFQHVLFFL